VRPDAGSSPAACRDHDIDAVIAENALELDDIGESDAARLDNEPATAVARSVHLSSVPRLAEVIQLQRILGNHGVDIMIAQAAGERTGVGPHFAHLGQDIIDTTAPTKLVSHHAASFWVIAPLLRAWARPKVSMPGGCAIARGRSTC